MPNLQVIFCYYGVDKTTGNKKKFQYCFRHAVTEVILNNANLEIEVADSENYWVCNICEKEK
jgi:hypothetical protein